MGLWTAGGVDTIFFVAGEEFTRQIVGLLYGYDGSTPFSCVLSVSCGVCWYSRIIDLTHGLGVVI